MQKKTNQFAGAIPAFQAFGQQLTSYDNQMSSSIQSTLSQISIIQQQVVSDASDRASKFTVWQQAQAARLQAEAAYNQMRQAEEAAQASLTASDQLLQSTYSNYTSTYSSDVVAIQGFDHERSTVEQIRELLTTANIGSWTPYQATTIPTQYTLSQQPVFKFTPTIFNSNIDRFQSVTYYVLWFQCQSGMTYPNCINSKTYTDQGSADTSYGGLGTAYAKVEVVGGIETKRFGDGVHDVYLTTQAATLS